MSDYKTIVESNNFIVLDKYNKEWAVAEGYQTEGDLERELIEDLINQGICISVWTEKFRCHAGQYPRSVTKYQCYDILRR
ncbi:hypothetical protein MASR2M48_31870 [Spirochaetota bacterium]